MMTSPLAAYRNRAAGYNRWLRTLAADVTSDLSPVNRHCVCSVVADYNDAPFGPSVHEALQDWPFARQVISVSGSFSRAGGMQIAMDVAITTPPKASLVYFMDADMVAYPGFLQRSLTHGG